MGIRDAEFWNVGVRARPLLRFGDRGRNNSASFADRKNLIGFDLLELFYFPRRGPLHFNQIDHLIPSQAKVKPQVAL